MQRCRLTLAVLTQEDADVCRVVLVVKEKSRLKVHAGVYAQGNEGALLPSSLLSCLCAPAKDAAAAAQA